ncbi:hypothetical protein GWC95_06845 [Sediminibacterium roseum]|uniref:TonB-dependent receptor plug domain-containing protein n=1 Tax=Sediminibacterium roseum TaxID=1978412 RepID=A0ABW9ZRA6_9BACT|nr:TonB-dependent receptor plug domain-containing protein [Sediminibacterium roseum]NCI49631.1 hypothetical protein [Sediminibacterium roseum]
MSKSFQNPAYYFLILVAVLCHASTCEGQFIDGKLVDRETGVNIPSALVSLQDSGSGLVLSYTTTDKAGLFKIRFANTLGKTLWLKFNALGFHQDSLRVGNQLEGLLIKLVPFVKELPSVTVKNRKSFLNSKPDTSSYNAEAFTQKQDRTIEDVLKNVPGIEIQESGRISYNGRAISNFYIDGDDIVSDRYTIATRTIRPEMVDKIQVIDNHNAIRVLESAVLSNQVALNLSLKNEARLALLGNTKAGAGNRDVYTLEANLLSFKKNLKFIDLVNANNAGVEIASQLSAHNITELARRLDHNTTRTLLTPVGAGSPEIGQQRYLFNHTGLVTLNNSFSVKPETNIRFNMYYLQNNKMVSSDSRSVFFLPTSTITYNENKSQKYSEKSFNSELTATVNKKDIYLNNILSCNVSNPSVAASLVQNGKAFAQQYANRNWYISNDLSVIKKSANRNLSEFTSYFYYKKSPEKLSLSPGLTDSIFNSGVPYQRITQSVMLSDFFSNQSFSYRVVSEFLVQHYKAGVIVQVQQLGSDMTTIDDLGTLKILTDSFANNILWKHYKAYIKADYDIINGKHRVSVSFPVYLHIISKESADGAKEERFTKPMFSPLFRWRYDMGKENTISTNYQFAISPTSIYESYDNYILSNYLLLQSWKIPVTTNTRHSFSVGWMGRKSARLLTGNASIGFNTGVNGYLPGNSYRNALEIQNNVEGMVRTSNLIFNSGISKHIFLLRTNFSANLDIQKSDYEQLLQEQLSRFVEVRSSISLKAQTKIAVWLTGLYNISYTVSKSRNRNYEIIPEQSASQVNQHFELNIFPMSGLSMKLSGDKYRTIRNQSVLSGAFFTDAQVLYNFGKRKIELSLNATNITNPTDFTTLTISGNNSKQVSFPLRRSQVVFSLRYWF